MPYNIVPFLLYVGLQDDDNLWLYPVIYKVYNNVLLSPMLSQMIYFRTNKNNERNVRCWNASMFWNAWAWWWDDTGWWTTINAKKRDEIWVETLLLLRHNIRKNAVLITCSSSFYGNVLLKLYIDNLTIHFGVLCLHFQLRKWVSFPGHFSSLCL